MPELPINVCQKIIVYLGLLQLVLFESRAAVVAPPWADPDVNPCAAKPRGWQLLYWPADGKCYKIFQKGYPCPNDMELSPTTTQKREFTAECRCPPTTAESAQNGKCYDLFSAGPCERGYYFAPSETQDAESEAETTKRKRRWGACKQTGKCTNINEVFWPATGKCYLRHSVGPCPEGQLLTTNSHGFGACKCDTTLQEYHSPITNGCYQHFTRGPCKQSGHIFLPDRNCGCHRFLPHFHTETERCYELGTRGPCKAAEQIHLNPDTNRAVCACKNGHIRYVHDSNCYRPYTEGPCGPNHILVNATTCISQPCERGQLYFPSERRCFRVGTRGPCSEHEVVVFDFETRPSVDGISYNGLCGCRGSSCDDEKKVVTCEKGAFLFENRCYGLYTQGPCAKGAWIVPKREGKEEIWSRSKRKRGVCECMPGYVKRVRTSDGESVTECLPPTVILADYMNKYFSKTSGNVTVT